jgi:translocation and assembly module TamB
MKGKKILGWVFGVLATLLLLIVVAGYFFLKSEAVNQFARRKIGEKVQQSTGALTTIGRLDFSLSTLTAHLYNITLRGREDSGQPALLSIDEITVSLRIQSVLQRKASLSQLIVKHPVAHIRVSSQGMSNLPFTPPAQGGARTNIFELAVGHAQLINGELNYNDKKTPLDADLSDLDSEIRLDPSAERYSGSISYNNGHLRYGEYSALPHRLQAVFNATPVQLSIESAVLKIGNSVASVRGNVSNYSNPLVQGDYDVRVDAHDLAAIAPEYKPSGDVSLLGTMSYRSSPDQSLLRALTINGQIAGKMLSAVVEEGRISVTGLRGSYRLAGGSFEAREVEFRALGGNVSTELSIQNLDGTPSGRVRSSVHSISLREMQREFRPQATKPVAISGVLNGMADASWKGSVASAFVRSDLMVSGAARNASQPSTAPSVQEVPVDATIHATYDGARKVITFRQSTLHIPSATVVADGQVSNRSSLRLQATANDLRQLESLAAIFAGHGYALPPISGSAALSAEIHGSLARPQVAAQLSAQNLNVQGTEWRSLQANIQASPSQIAISNGSLIHAQRGRASFSGTVALQKWHYLAGNSFAGNLSLQQMAIVDLQHAADLQYPVSGDLWANISLQGTELSPQGSGKVQITNAHAYGEPIQALVVEFHADQGTVISSLHIAVAAGSADANFSYAPKSNVYTLRVDAPALVLQKLHTVQAKNLALTGTLTASVSGRGTVDNPQLSAALQLPQLTVRGKSITGIKAELQVADHQADVTLNSSVLDSSVQAQARVNLTGEYYTDASINTTRVPLDVLLASYLMSVPQDFKGETELHATLKGPLKDKTQLEAHVTIPTLNASYQSLQIGIVSPVHADFANSVLTILPAEIRGTDTDLRVQGTVPFSGNASPSLTAQGSVDVTIAKIFSPDTQSSGTVSFDVHASGTAKDPSVNGQLRLQDVGMFYSGAPVGVEKLNGTLDIGKESIQISQLTGRVGGGDISAGGSIVYRPSPHFNLAMQGKSIRLRYPAGLRTLLDGNLIFSGNKDSSTLTGRVLIDSLGFTPDFDLSNLADRFSSGASLPSQPGFADNVNLGISVQSKDNLSANSSQISIEGGVNLRVIGTLANPVVTGRTDLTSGELFYRNIRYQLQRGIITFDNPNETSPVLNVSATTTVEQYNLSLNLRGPFDKLTTSYTSDPPLATADIINLIARGQTTEESAAASQSTDSMIASQATSQLTGGIQKLTGISSLEIDPLSEGSNQNPSARIALQQRVTKNFLFTFSTDVSQPGSEVVQGEYQINKRWSVSATRDQVGGISVDGRLHTRF